jgi:hypothetical protein
MSQFVLTPEERAEAVQRLGYTEREAAFLCLAALHGGFFLRRQYAQYTGRQIGGTAAELVRKTLAYGHATSVTGCHNTKVYHLCSRPFYAALGQEDNRNRRTRSPAVIKNRLMCLDFVLEHPGRRFLATEQEKVSYFTRELGIQLSELPAKVFRGVEPKQTAKRFFPDKYPIIVPDKETNTGEPVSFSFVDEGLATAARFETYLEEYGRLFAALGRFRLIYVAAVPSVFWVAKNAFDATISRMHGGFGIELDARKFGALIEHFEARRLFEARRFDSFDREKLIQFRDDRERFSRAEYNELYKIWCTSGETGIRQKVLPFEPRENSIAATFDTHLLKHNYELFGYLRPQAETVPESAVETL